MTLRWTPTHEHNEKIFLKGRLRGFDPQASVLSNVRPFFLVIMLTGTGIGVQWQGLLVDRDQNDLHLGNATGVRHNLAVFRDV